MIQGFGGADTIAFAAETDTGISKDDSSRIWERLYRGDKSRSERGLGLGLSLVKAIVGAHRGRVEAASFERIRSEFTIYLPAISTGDFD